MLPTYQTASFAATHAHVQNSPSRAGWWHAPTVPLLCFVLVDRAQLSMAADPDASIALPFTPRPAMLNGELVGDVGFDPLNFSEEVRRSFAWQGGCLCSVYVVHESSDTTL